MKKHYLNFMLMGVIASFLFSSCASIFTKSTYPVIINSDPADADITITTSKGKLVYEGSTPAVVKLKSSTGYFAKAEYLVTISLQGYKDQTVSIGSNIEGWYFGNILFGGIIGMLIVDPVTGAMWTLDTEEINVKLKPLGGNQEEASLQIVNINDVDEDLKDKLVRIN